VNDAYEFYNMLLEFDKWNFHNLDLYLKTFSDDLIKDKMDMYSNFSDSNDVFLFFYSGHGGYTSVDGAFFNTIDDPIFDDDLNDKFSNIHGNKIIIIQSCKCGMFSKIRQNGREILLAGKDEQLPNLMPGEPNSLMVMWLIEGLDERTFSGFLKADLNFNNIVTAQELFLYTKIHVILWLVKSLSNPMNWFLWTQGKIRWQNPTIIDSYDGDLIIAENL